MTSVVPFSHDDSMGLARIRRWCHENQLTVGIGEMALGASLIAWGVHNGAIDMGSQLVGTQLGGGANIESLAGATAGSGVGAVVGSIVGSIGIAGMGGAIGIPAAIIIGGGAAVLAMAGYTAGDILHNVVSSNIDYASIVGNGSLLLIGAALMVDGGRRFIGSDLVQAKLSSFKKDILHLKDISLDIIARTYEELCGYIEELKKLPEDSVDATFSAGSGSIGAVGGAAAGGAIAASSVTVLGSSTLGGAAVSLGIVSAPLWPVIAGVAAGAGLGYATYKAVKYWAKKPDEKKLIE